jgi:hypothetical protein
MRTLLAAALVAFVSLFPAAGVQPATAAGQPQIVFVTPQDGTTVAGPVEVAIAVNNFTLVPAGSQTKDGLGHAHVLVDTEPPAPRSFLPTNDPSIIHMGAPPFETRAIDLSPGQHTLYAVLGDSDHLVVANQQPAKVTITVAPGLRFQGPLDQACASDVSRGAGEVRIAFPVTGGALQGTVTSTCGFVTDGGKCEWTDAAFRRVNGTFDLEQKSLKGTASGFTSRQLKAGSRKSCGADQTTALSAQPFAAEIQNQAVQGTLGRSTFTLALDESSRLASPPATALASASGGGGGRSPWAYAPFGGAALLLIGAGYYAAKNRPQPQTD